MTTTDMFKKVLHPGTPNAAEIVWLHGWGQTHESLVPLAGLFKRGFKNILFDLPGFGKTPRLPDNPGTEAYARLLIETLEKDNNVPVILAGHSFGCRIAIRVAAMRPDLVGAMVLVAAAGLKRTRGPGYAVKSFFLKTLGKLAGTSDRVFKTGFREKFRNKFGSRDYREAGELRETFVKTVTEDLSPVAEAVACPVLLLYGEADSETPPELGKRYESLIPGARLKILSGYGHLDILTDGRHQCQHYMDQFLAGLEDLWKA